MKVVRSWSNSWATSHRFHEHVRLPCLFGCIGELDSMSHYTKCPILFSIIRILRPDTSPCHATRFGLVNHSESELMSLACTYTAYHNLRRDPELQMHVFNPHALRTFASRIFGESFFAAALDLGLQCRKPFPTLSSFPTKFGEWENLMSMQDLDHATLIAVAESCLTDDRLSDDFPLFGLAPARFEPAPRQLIPEF